MGHLHGDGPGEGYDIHVGQAHRYNPYTAEFSQYDAMLRPPAV